mgnify:FL=1
MIAHRALQNPDLFTSVHYKQAALAVIIGIIIRLLIALPVHNMLPRGLSQKLTTDMVF